MNKQEMEGHLFETVKKLEIAAEKIVQTNGYTAEARKMRLLIELVKEQIRHENSMPATRPVR